MLTVQGFLLKEECGGSAGQVRAHLPAKSMNSVSEREPRAEKSRKADPAADPVRARLPAKPMNSVSEREPRGGSTQDSFLKKS